MDAVELSFPAAVAVSTLLTSDGFSTVEKAEAPSPESVCILVSPSVTGCSSSRSHKDVACEVIALEENPDSIDRKADAELCRNGSQLPNFQGDNIADQLYYRGTNILLPKFASEQLHRKGEKMSRSGSPCSKRLRTEQVEDFTSNTGTDNRNITSENFGSNLTKCTFAEKTRVIKQKHGLDGKQGDKRNSKAPVKKKVDSFSFKAGYLSSNSSAGGNNILGIYGLKSDIHDVAKHVDELSLNELLDGSYRCPNLCQDKGRKAANNTNENILLSIQKACSLSQRPVQSQDVIDLNSFWSRRLLTGLPSSCSCVTSSMDCDKGSNCVIALASSSKVCNSCSKTGASTHTSEPLLQPKDILERLALPPANDLDFLLLDTAKHAASSRNAPELRSGQSVPRRGRLPPFPWSNSPGWPFKVSNDAGKFSTNRSTCQSKWVRIGSTIDSLGGVPGCFSDLDSLTYSQSLAPLGDVKLGISDNRKDTSPVGLPSCEQVSLSVVTCPTAFHVPSAEDNLKFQRNGTILNGLSQNNLFSQENEDSYMDKEQIKDDACNKGSHYFPLKSAIGEHDQLLSRAHLEYSEIDGHSPRLLAAAQTLYEIASHSTKQNQISGMIRWPKKPSQKVMKARKSRSSTGKSEVLGPGVSMKITDSTIRSKKPKVLVFDKKKDPGHRSNSGRGPIQWSVPTSSRSERDSFADTKQSKAGIVKLLGMMPPSSTRMSDKACSSQQKLRKPPVALDWIRGRNKKE